VNKLGDVVDLENVEAFDGEPSPQLLAELKDQQQYLFELLRTDEHRYIAAAKLEGYSSEEIAQAMGISSRTVQRKVTQIYERWSRQLDGPAEP
jgi:DNA-directed RNA polymerase specialized sigma24 family protein